MVKLWCVPFEHNFFEIPYLSRLYPFNKILNPNKIYVRSGNKAKGFYCDQELAKSTMMKAVGMRRIAEECGMESIVQEVDWGKLH